MLTGSFVRSFVSTTTTSNSSRLEASNKENSRVARLRKTSARRRRIIIANFSGPTPAAARRHHTRPSRTHFPSNDAQMHMALSNPQHDAHSQRRITIPRHLPRPRYSPIDPQAVIDVDSVLEDIPLNYVQYSLQEIGPQLLQATCNATATPPTGHLPRELQVICNDVSMEPPSHVLAAYTRPDTPHFGVILFPVHALVLAANCALLPSLPPSKPDRPAAPGGSVTLPVVPLCIPYPAAFPALLSYIYTKRADPLFAELLPMPFKDEVETVDQLARRHAAAYGVKALVGYARTVHGLWSNASALGVFENKLFMTLELAWEVLLGALAISGERLDEGLEVDAE